VGKLRRSPGGSSAKQIRLPKEIASFINIDSDRIIGVIEDMPVEQQPEDDTGGEPIEDPTPPIIPPPTPVDIPTFRLDTNGNILADLTYVTRDGTVFVDAEIEIIEVSPGMTYEVRFA
jgi:hypothetical protein